MLANFSRVLGAGAIACLAACTTGQSPPPNPSAAAALPAPGSAPVAKKPGVTIVAPYAPPQGPPEYIPPKPRGPDDGYFVWNAGTITGTARRPASPTCRAVSSSGRT